MKEATIFLGLIILTTMTTTVESGLQNVQLLNSLLRFCADSGGFFKIGNQNNLATLPGFASVLINGYTYSYVYKDPRNGEKCCRPIKSKCEWEEIIVQNLFTKKMPKKRRDTCKITRGDILCGKRCTRIRKALEKLQREVEGREKEEKERTEEGKEEEKESKEALITHSSEDERKEKDKQSNEKEKEREEKGQKEKERREKERERKEKEGQRDYVEIHAAPGMGAKGLEVKKGQKLSQRQLQMIETAAEEKDTQSRNPLCREEKNRF